MRTRFLASSLALAAASSLVLWTSPVARAQEVVIPLSDILAFTGNAVIDSDGNTPATLPPPWPTTPPVPTTCFDPQDQLSPPGVDLQPKVDAMGGCGKFHFGSDVCAGVSDPNTGASDPTQIVEAGTCSITATGQFSNVVCGTGLANGNANINSAFDNGVATFGIVFVATIGIVLGTETEAGANGDPGGSDILVGVVQLGPSTLPQSGPLPDGPPDCTGAFSIVGVVVGIDLS